MTERISDRHLGKLIADNASLALFVMDDQQRCTFMNAAAEELTGFTAAEVVAAEKPLHDLIHHLRPDGTPYPLAECPIDRALPERARTRGEDVFVHRSGRFYPVAFTASPIVEDGKPIGTVIEVRDLTQERAMAAALRERDDRYRFLAETIPVQIWTALPDGRLDYVTEQTARTIGRTAAQLLDEGWLSVLHPDDVAPTIERWTRSLGTGEVYEVEFRLRMTDGRYAAHLARAVPQRGPDGGIIRWFGTNTNIEEQKEERRRITALLQEVESQAMASTEALLELRAAKDAAEARVKVLEEALARH
jgi:PAS domain S-box-containing protein